ncbi:BRD4-interacting chromatin-remodeling complex-associated protein isoform X2 [Folsomia candida]|uniref:BRD4-interacting chromatin-remodeling complex-associated protein isoform X2 n=1 Tax=Folsomia candida TaxID=158441 RepID=UPI001604BC08|nr:BRD4-interacting chromatin-remodeling complex-associated protein isoform X2 [Folsomia candida]
MSDGGQQQQRVLDLIDDPNALESFLGGLTSDSELLPSAESVDNVVASLARSLEADYEVDSPNETLFDTLEASSNNLTDISQSYVPSDFENAIANATGGGGGQQGFNNSMGSLSNGEVNNHVLQQQQQQQTLQNSLSSIVTSGVDQFLMSSSQTNSIASSSLQQLTSNCDSSSSASQFLQQHQIQMNQTQVILDSNNVTSSYSFSQELLQKQQTIVNQQTQQIPSLSSTTSLNHQQTDSSSLNQSISVSMPCNQNNNTGQLTTHNNAFQQQQQAEVPQQQHGQIQIINQHLQQVPNNSTSNPAGTNNSSSATNNDGSNNNNVNNIPINNSASISVSNSSILRAQPHYIQSTTHPQQQTTLNQLVSAGQTVSLAGAHQLLATSTGNIMTTGQAQTNIIQQIQTGGGQSYITMDQPTTALIAGPGTFGGANLALLATGGAPTYAVVNTGTQFLSNTIMAQPQAFQTCLTKGPNGTYYQTTAGGAAQLVATSNVGQIQNVNVSMASSPIASKPKQPPQLLPKPQSSSSPANVTTNEVDGNNMSAPSTTVPNGAHNTVSVNTSDGVTQIFQQQQGQVVVTSVGNTMIPQQSFTIGGAGLQQMVMSQNANQQTQLTGTIVVNQYGQPMLVPSGGQQGIQFIVRPQQQVLTLQPGTTTIGAQANNGKPIVRYVSQMPQVAQTQGYGLQQIQTPNGPAWVAVRYPPATTLTTSSGQFSQMQTDSNIITSQTAQISSPPQQQQQHIGQVQIQTTQPQQLASTPIITTTATTPNSQTQQPVVSQPQKPPTTNKLQKSNIQQNIIATPDSSSEPSPPKKPKSKPKASKKKVTLDLEQLLKQSGIMDEDLQDDSSFDFSFSSQDATQNGFDIDFLQTPSEVKTLNSLQDPGVNSSGKTKGGGKKRPSTSGGSTGGSSNKKKKSPQKQKPPTPPPPPPPTPPTPRSRPKKKGGGGNQKADSKTENSKNEPVKKVSSLDDIMSSIDAVANAACSPSPPSSPASSLPLSSPARVLTPATPAPMTPTSPAIPSSIKQPSTPIQQVQVMAPVTPTSSSLVSIASNGINNNPNPVASLVSSNAATRTTTRIVQTIQLTPQNQHLLRNIQAQISRLLSLPKRNETEQTALQKLIVLQQQVISTGIPVPNPSHLSNENATTSASNMVVSSSTFASGTSTTNALGQHHVQSFPTTFKSPVDEKKADDQRVVNLKVEEEKRSRWKKEEFEMLLKRDQQCVTQPDYEIPFTDKRDAVERLMKYHILRDRNDMNFEEFDNEFCDKASVLLDKFHGMVSKYRSLLLKESMKEVGCAERVMLERMFVTEEKMKMEQDRLFISQGEVLDLPPPPAGWVPKIQEMVDKEMKEMEQDSYVNMQVQSAIDSIIGFGNIDSTNAINDDENKIEYDAFGVPINNNGGLNTFGLNTSSADIDEAVRSIMM